MTIFIFLKVPFGCCEENGLQEEGAGIWRRLLLELSGQELRVTCIGVALMLVRSTQSQATSQKQSQKDSLTDWKLVVRERGESKQLSSWEGSGAIYEDGKSKERSRFGFGRWESTVLFCEVKLQILIGWYHSLTQQQNQKVLRTYCRSVTVLGTGNYIS